MCNKISQTLIFLLDSCIKETKEQIINCLTSVFYFHPLKQLLHKSFDNSHYDMDFKVALVAFRTIAIN